MINNLNDQDLETIIFDRVDDRSLQDTVEAILENRRNASIGRKKSAEEIIKDMNRYSTVLSKKELDSRGYLKQSVAAILDELPRMGYKLIRLALKLDPDNEEALEGLKLARKEMIKADPYAVLHYFIEDNMKEGLPIDYTGLRILGSDVLKNRPEIAYWAYKSLGDDEGRKEAKETMLSRSNDTDRRAFRFMIRNERLREEKGEILDGLDLIEPFSHYQTRIMQRGFSPKP